MSGSGAPDHKPIDCRELRVAVVASSWHEEVMDGLLDGADRALRAYKVEAPVVFRVPGAFELPVAASACAAQGYDAVVALGVVIRGGTPHFDYVAGAVSKGVFEVAMQSGVPVSFGVLTTDTIEQAVDRAGAKAGNKGFDAAVAAIEMVTLSSALGSAGL